jgi:hypothetical protein
MQVSRPSRSPTQLSDPPIEPPSWLPALWYTSLAEYKEADEFHALPQLNDLDDF